MAVYAMILILLNMIPQDGNVGSKPLRHAGKRNTIQIISKFKAKIRSKKLK